MYNKYFALHGVQNLAEKEGNLMADSIMLDKAKDFAVDIVKTCKTIKADKKESVLTNQLLRSGTSIGANIHESKYAHGTADFISKMQIALKECYESEYWLELLFKTDFIEEDKYNELKNACGTIRRMLILSINTAKKKNANYLEVFMNLFNSIKNGFESVIFSNKKEQLHNEYNNITYNKTKVKEKSTKKTYYLFTDKDATLDTFKVLYILGMWEEVSNLITSDNIDNIDILNDLATHYSYDEIIYTEGGVSYYQIITSSEVLEFEIMPNETSVTNRLTWQKNIYFDPIFRNEFQKWKDGFLPEKYISVKLDYYDTANNPETAQMLKETVVSTEIPANWMYVKNEYLCVQPVIHNFAELKGLGKYKGFDEKEITKYKLCDIKCFITYGDIEKDTLVSGGSISGGEINVVGAMVGGALLGDVGAILGGRTPIESTPISTNIVKKDNRIIRILVNNKFIDLLPEGATIHRRGKNDEKTSTIKALSVLIPEKDYRLLSLKKDTISENDDIFLKIEKLKELCNKGIITEDEFKNKKNELLKKI